VKAHVENILLFTVNLFKAETRGAYDWTEALSAVIYDSMIESRLYSRDGSKFK